MNKELIERLARQSGAVFYGPCSWADPMELRFDRAGIEHFVALVAEECAKVADAQMLHAQVCAVGYLRGAKESAEAAALISAAIREKFKAA
jgi:hypothetical protein